MSRRLSGIRFAHRMRDLPDPTASARVIAVWEGIRSIPLRAECRRSSTSRAATSLIRAPA